MHQACQFWQCRRCVYLTGAFSGTIHCRRYRQRGPDGLRARPEPREGGPSLDTCSETFFECLARTGVTPIRKLSIS
jgi:hypothetical protein